MAKTPADCRGPVVDYSVVKRQKREQLISELLSDYLEHWNFLTNLGLLWFVLNFRNNLINQLNCISDSPIFLRYV